jgi:hypothetical protein
VRGSHHTRVIVRMRARMCLCVAVIAAVRLGNTYGHKWYNVHVVPYQIALYGVWQPSPARPSPVQPRESRQTSGRFSKSADQLNIRSADQLFCNSGQLTSYKPGQLTS